MQLNHGIQPWALNIEKCPCDLHFLQYLSRNGLNNKTIFHFGTGLHHLIGRENVLFEHPNQILGITACRAEYERYMDLVIDNPLVGLYYKVIFMDIYTMNPRLLPAFDLVTMFHLFEFRDERNSVHLDITDSGLLDLAISLVKQGGRIFFYKNAGRGAAERVSQLLQKFSESGKLQYRDSFRSLLVYERG